MIFYSSDRSVLEKLDVLWKVYRFLIDLRGEYPNFSYWYWVKVALGLFMGSRDILYCVKNDEIAAVAIIKYEPDEKKICTLRVREDSRREGLGSLLLTASCEKLETNKPLITVSESKLCEFEKFLKINSFVFVEACSDYYLTGTKEYCFNGRLSKESANSRRPIKLREKSFC